MLLSSRREKILDKILPHFFFCLITYLFFILSALSSERAARPRWRARCMSVGDMGSFSSSLDSDDLFRRIRVYFVLFTKLTRALSSERMRNSVRIENDTFRRKRSTGKFKLRFYVVTIAFNLFEETYYKFEYIIWNFWVDMLNLFVKYFKSFDSFVIRIVHARFNCCRNGERKWEKGDKAPKFSEADLMREKSRRIPRTQWKIRRQRMIILFSMKIAGTSRM